MPRKHYTCLLGLLWAQSKNATAIPDPHVSKLNHVWPGIMFYLGCLSFDLDYGPANVSVRALTPMMGDVTK